MEHYLGYILTFIVGLLTGALTVHMVVIPKINRHDVKIENIEKNCQGHRDEYKSAIELLTKLVDQNNLIIQSIIAHKE